MCSHAPQTRDPWNVRAGVQFKDPFSPHENVSQRGEETCDTVLEISRGKIHTQVSEPDVYFSYQV